MPDTEFWCFTKWIINIDKLVVALMAENVSGEFQNKAESQVVDSDAVVNLNLKQLSSFKRAHLLS